MIARDALVVRSDGLRHRVRLRTCTTGDVRVLCTTWPPVFDQGPAEWLDREWRWDALDDPEQLAFRESLEWIVAVDEAEAGAEGGVLGVLVTTGAITVAEAALDPAVVGERPLVWVEYIAISPTLRPECPPFDRRQPLLKGVGRTLMLCAIERSVGLGCDGRIGLHAEGAGARDTYLRWKKQNLPDAPHPAGGTYPVFFGDADWARGF
jgi:hypothetical protein